MEGPLWLEVSARSRTGDAGPALQYVWGAPLVAMFVSCFDKRQKDRSTAIADEHLFVASAKEVTIHFCREAEDMHACMST